ncbi:TPA: DUF4339 domain-containing protein [Photobacterium damselae]
MTSWYYVDNGAQIGPINDEEIKKAIELKKITPITKVWAGEGDWILAKDTTLSELFVMESNTTPPPLAGEDIDNKYVWILSIIPILSVIIDLLAGTTLFFPAIIANIGLCIFDERKLKTAGHATPQHWSVFIVPVYLWKRAKLLNHKKHYFIAWLVCFIFSIMMNIGVQRSEIEDTACSVVTDIIHNQFHQSSVCKAVEIDDELTSGFYSATAILNNGNSIDITIEDKDDGMIYVNIIN